jgi:hypothetical protein
VLLQQLALQGCDGGATKKPQDEASFQVRPIGFAIVLISSITYMPLGNDR